MGRYILKRIFAMVFVVLGVTFLIFTILYFTPGDPARMILGADATDAEVLALRAELGLDDPFLVRFFTYVKQVFIDFDLGTSYVNNRSVSSEILSRFPKTFEVAILSVVFAVVIGIPLGIMAAVNQYTWKDNASMVVALLGVSMPHFWVGLMLSLLFALKLGWLPASGFGGIEYLIMPCLSIGLGGAGGIARQTRSSMLEVIRQDYIVTARAKGLKESTVIYVHALRNALIPIITQVGNMLGVQLGGAIVVESVFSIPGLGSYMVSGIKSRDYPAVQGSVLFVSIVFGLVMLLVDIMYAFADPRIKAQYQRKRRKG